MTKGREIIIFTKSQPPFDVHRQYLQYLDVSLIDSQARGLEVSLSNFSLFC